METDTNLGTGNASLRERRASYTELKCIRALSTRCLFRSENGSASFCSRNK